MGCKGSKTMASKPVKKNDKEIHLVLATDVQIKSFNNIKIDNAYLFDGTKKLDVYKCKYSSKLHMMIQNLQGFEVKEELVSLGFSISIKNSKGFIFNTFYFLFFFIV